MKYIKLLLILGVVSIAFSSCYKEEDWLEDNIKEGGIYFPVLQVLSTEAGEEGYKAGTTAQVVVQYWSRDDVRNVEVFHSVDFAEETLFVAVPYSDNYDEETGAQIMKIDYPLSASHAAGTNIDLRVVVNTVNDLSKEKTTSMTIE